MTFVESFKSLAKFQKGMERLFPEARIPVFQIAGLL